MIRGLKGILALVALAGLGLVLRWMTAGSTDAANSQDLVSMTVLAIGTVAWMAYGWLALAVLATVLEQLPGAIGAVASAVAGRITSQASRSLLRSALGLAAATPLTIGAAHASPVHDTITHPGHRSTVQPTNTPWGASEPPSGIRLTERSAQSSGTSWRTTEPPSTIRLTGPTQPARPQDATPHPARPQDATAQRARPQGVTAQPARPQDVAAQPARPQSIVGPPTRPQDPQGARPQDVLPAAPRRTTSQPDPDSTSGTCSGRSAAGTRRDVGANARTRTDLPANARTRTDLPADARTRGDLPADARTRADLPADARTGAGVPGEVVGGEPRVRVGVPDRPTSGAATRYTDVRSGQPVRVPARVVVKPGDTLWSIAATELGPNASAEDVANRWPAWYAANRPLIGPDPDLILPGQVLRIPASATGNPVPPTHQEK
jgi:nucleoid-associated protein YgaU